MKQNFLYFYPFNTNEEVQINFKSGKSANELIELTKLDGYKIYQYIQSDYTYNMSIEELEFKNIEFKKIYRKVKTWFGLSKKTVTDLLIKPKKGFYYPYGYGYYLYLFTKRKFDESDFESWINNKIPTNSLGVEEIFTGFKSLTDENDYFILTSHDYQEDFDLIGTMEVIDQIISKFNNLNLKEYKIEKHLKE